MKTTKYGSQIHTGKFR